MKRFSLCIFLLLALALAACQPAAGGAAVDISGVEWKLAQLNGSAPLAGSTTTLKFEGGQAGGNAGCNSYGGEVSFDGAALTFTNLAQTEMACMDPAGVMEQESAFLMLLSQAATFTASNTTLELKNASGETILVFTK